MQPPSNTTEGLDRILSMSDEKVIEEIKKSGQDPYAVAEEVRNIVTDALKK